MTTPFDVIVEQIRKRGFHNQRQQEHSDAIGRGILEDLRRLCPPLRRDLDSGVIRSWLNRRTPGARGRKVDLLIGEPGASGEPDLDKLRICAENKSVVTAHRNSDARFDDLNESLQVLHRAKSEAVLVATVMIGVAERVLNVPDRITPFFKNRMSEFEKNVLPRLSSGDSKLWDEFSWAVSVNKPEDPARTAAKFRKLAVRSPGHTHIVGYDYVLLVPVYIDNVNPPFIPRPNKLGIDVDRQYQAMLTQICKAYRARWHL
jgi:hypothetical protein